MIYYEIIIFSYIILIFYYYNNLTILIVNIYFMRSLPKIIAVLILINLLSSCTSHLQDWPKWWFEKWNQQNIEKQDSDTWTDISTETTNNSTSKIKQSDTDWKKLTINEKCIGCGHCVRFAAQNFAMNSSHRAEVISQENINSDDVSMAINRCPVDAIIIG